jgi:RNA polymerase sigma-70 factor (ECF subfamily)
VLLTPQIIEVQTLFLRHHAALRAFVFSILPDTTAVDDIVQEVFLVATKHAGDFQPGSNFFTWVCEIARRRVLSERRKNTRFLLAPDVLEALFENVPKQAFDHRRLSSLANCLDQLPPRLQQLIKLRHLESKGAREIGQLLNRSVNSVKVALSKARTMLRGCIEREMRREDAQ